MRLTSKNIKNNILRLFSLLLLISVYSNQAVAQIKYSYDASGNRIKRAIIISMPRSHSENANSDSTQSQEEAMRIAMDKGISVYPNPANDKVNVTVSTANEVTHAFVYFIDNGGRVLFSKEVTSFPYSIDLTEYKPGTYYVKVVTGKDQLSYQVIKSY